MLPFVLLLVPSFVAVVARAFPSIVPPDVRASGFKQLPKRLLGQALIVPGVAMILTGLTMTYAPLDSYFSTNIAASYLPITTLNLIQLLLYGGGLALTVLGGVLVAKKSNL